MVKVVCPKCGGAKSSYAISCSDRGCETGVRACEFCKGEGQVSSEAGERWRTGKAMRDERVKQGRTQQQEAEWLGISPMELNDIEHGRRSLDELKSPTIAEKDQSRGRGANREVKKMSLNRVSLIGHLGQDPELRYLPTSGQPVTGFSIATDESFTGKDGNRQERVEWHNIVVFGKLAETCAKYLSKGRQLYVEGRLQTREFESKNGGGKRQRAEIVAQRVQFLGPRPEAPAGGEAEEPAASEEVPF
jgi:single-strand DNA-binding protein